MNTDELLAVDRAHVWHPYASMPATVAPVPIVAARGVHLTTADGRELVDGMSSWPRSTDTDTPSSTLLSPNS